MRQVNLEEGLPTALEAINLLENMLKNARKDHIKFLVVIHGYGSSGKGGTIKGRVKTYLKKALDEKRIKGFIRGEDFSTFSEYARKICFQDQSLKEYYNRENMGITIIEL